MSGKKNTQFLTWAEINLQAIKRNYRAIRELAYQQFQQPTRKKKKKKDVKRKFPEILAVIKADAYGHGMVRVAHALSSIGVGMFGVSDVAEGIELRKNGIKKPILLFESALPSSTRDIVDYDLTPTVCTVTFASSLNTYAKQVNRVIDVHIKVDTGMGRLGVWHSEAGGFIHQVMQFPNVAVKGIYTHFPVADSDPRYTRNQTKQLFQLIDGLDKNADIVPYIHAANSMGLAGYKTYVLNLARPGLMLYGLYPNPKLKRKISLKPAMSIKSRIIFLKKIPKGQGISYGHSFVAERNTVVATLPIGYNDGYMRCLSNRTHVIVEGKRCPVIGRVTMDQIMVDVTKAKGVKIGAEATILGRNRSHEISADELALEAGTINYEIVCSLGNRLPRVYK